MGGVFLIEISGRNIRIVSLLQNPFFRESKRNRMEHEYESEREPRSILQVPHVALENDNNIYNYYRLTGLNSSIFLQEAQSAGVHVALRVMANIQFGASSGMIEGLPIAHGSRRGEGEGVANFLLQAFEKARFGKGNERKFAVQTGLEARYVRFAEPSCKSRLSQRDTCGITIKASQSGPRPVPRAVACGRASPAADRGRRAPRASRETPAAQAAGRSTLRRATPRRKRATANVSPVRRRLAGALNRASWRDRIAACASARAGSSVGGGHGLAHRSSESRRRSAASASGARATQPAQAGRRRRLGLRIRPAASRVGDDTRRRVRSAEDKDPQKRRDQRLTGDREDHDQSPNLQTAGTIHDHVARAGGGSPRLVPGRRHEGSVRGLACAPGGTHSVRGAACARMHRQQRRSLPQRRAYHARHPGGP